MITIANDLRERETECIELDIRHMIKRESISSFGSAGVVWMTRFLPNRTTQEAGARKLVFRRRSEAAVVAAAVTGFLQLNHHVVLLLVRDPDSIRIETLAQMESFHLHD